MLTTLNFEGSLDQEIFVGELGVKKVRSAHEIPGLTTSPAALTCSYFSRHFQRPVASATEVSSTQNDPAW